MKKIFSLIIAILGAFFLASCTPPVDNSYNEVPASITLTQDDFNIDGTKDGSSWNFWAIQLDSALLNQTVTFEFSCDMIIQNSVDEGSLMWQINTNNTYPEIARCDFKKNDSTTKHVANTGSVKLGNSAMFYLSNYNSAANETFSNKNFQIQVKNFSLKIDYVTKIPKDLSEDQYWLNVQSLKETFKDSGIEHIGFAVEGNELLLDSEKQKGLAYHATTTTMGNEFKPDFLFAWQLNQNTPLEDFTASNGLTIKVPENLAGLANADKYLAKCKDLGIKMRGHVLVWYSQTPKAFFCQDYDTGKEFVDKNTMTARQEWYIKKVLDHVAQWEAENSPDEHIIYTWDVVNEALSDGARAGAYLRNGNNSNWAKIYGDENYEFIINAFRFANKYAPEDVLLAYNDYNEASGEKFKGYLKIIDEIQKHCNDAELPARIDVAGMQSHNQPASPSLSDYETAIKSFIEKGLDVQVTELDITGKNRDSSYQTFDPPSAKQQKSTYKSYFELYQKYAKTEGKANGVIGVTIWGINDENSWRSSGEPLLFHKIAGKYYAKDAFYGVIESKK